MKAVKAQEIVVQTPNKVGALAQISCVISGAGINIRAISAWAKGESAFFRVIASDNAKTKEILAKEGYTVKEQEVVVVELPDQVGQLKGLSERLKDANVDLMHIYGTTSKPDCEAIVVFSSSDNTKALEILGA